MKKPAAATHQMKSETRPVRPKRQRPRRELTANGSFAQETDSMEAHVVAKTGQEGQEVRVYRLIRAEIGCRSFKVNTEKLSLLSR